MTGSFEGRRKKEEGTGRARVGGVLFLLPCSFFLAAAAAGTGCQQKMAEMPYYRPYTPTEFFPDGRSNRPLEPGVVHRAQRIDNDPLVTGLTQDEWSRFWHRNDNPPKSDAKVAAAATPDEDREIAYGAPRYDPRPGQPHSGPAVYATEFPFPITETDLIRGAERYSAYCAMCHGAMGNGKGKIWERGYLKPTSYHDAPVEPTEPVRLENGRYYDYGQIPVGYSRGYWKWDIQIPLRDAPVGYYFEVITKGYGAMGTYAAQVKPDDRWRIIAYIRTLQMSRRADAARLPEAVRQRVNAGGSQE
ncbi:MAG: cytochrome c [Gemmataceae bacterium]|nr:cytochrome c [Gemmataceae bacterium]